jgi:hypothetical protein
MSEKKRQFILSLFLMLFLWQIGFLCCGFLLQKNQVNAQISFFIDGIQEDENMQLSQFTEGFSDSDSQELMEEELELECKQHFQFQSVNLLPKKRVELFLPTTHYQNPFSPPEGVFFILI